MRPECKNNPFFIVFSVLLVLIMTVSVIALILSAGDKKNGSGYEDFSGGWLYEDGSGADLSRLTKSGVIRKQVPGMDSDEVLSFNARNINVDVYIGDECVYRTVPYSDPFLHAIFGKSPGSAFVEIPVLKEQDGKTLSVSVDIPYSNTTACRIVNMYFGDGIAIVKHDASIQLGSFCFGIIILFIGIVCIIVYIPMARHKLIDRSMLYLGMAAFTFGALMMTDDKMLHLIVGHETLYYTVSQMFLLITPMPLLLFFEKLYGDLSRKLIIALCAANTADFAAAFILTALGVIDYYENTLPMLLIYSVSIAYIGFITVKRIIRRDKDNIFHNIGVLMIVASIVLDMLMTNIGGVSETSFFTKIGIAGFTLLECIQVLWKHIENYQKGMKAQLISRLAYHDGLTDMLNRTSFMEDMDELENRDHSGVLIAVFDVNGLKYVNDTFGHTDGDELIVNTAEALDKAFDGIGKCYRTGGDEFVFISEQSDAERKFISACSVMNARLRELDVHSRYPVSIAVGYSVMDGSTDSLKDLLKKADERMYENKRRMKEKQAAEA